MTDLEVKKKVGEEWIQFTSRTFVTSNKSKSALVDLSDSVNRSPNSESPTVVSINHFAPHQLMLQLPDGGRLTFGDTSSEAGPDRRVIYLRPVRFRQRGRETVDYADVHLDGDIYRFSHAADALIHRSRFQTHQVLRRMRGR